MRKPCCLPPKRVSARAGVYNVVYQKGKEPGIEE
jgi:hypothetical protein